VTVIEAKATTIAKGIAEKIARLPSCGRSQIPWGFVTINLQL
jgi:hypothetical protein